MKKARDQERREVVSLSSLRVFWLQVQLDPGIQSYHWDKIDLISSFNSAPSEQTPVTVSLSIGRGRAEKAHCQPTAVTL